MNKHDYLIITIIAILILIAGLMFMGVQKLHKLEAYLSESDIQIIEY